MKQDCAKHNIDFYKILERFRIKAVVTRTFIKNSYSV